MDQGFKFKDILVVFLLIALLVTMWISMIQNDRQWDQLGQVQQNIADQTKDLTAIRRQLNDLPTSITVTPGSSSSIDTLPIGTPTGDPFRRLAQVKDQPDYTQGDWLVDAFASAVPNINEITAGDVYSRVIYTKVLEPLGVYDIGTREMVPLLAESWTMAADGLSATIRIRRNVTFSNGDPLTADDVVYSFTLLRNQNIVDGRVIEYYRSITGCHKIDDHTVLLTFERVFYENLLRALSVNIHNSQFLGQYTDEEIRQDPALLMGTGPYRRPDPTAYTPGENIVLLRNNRYWGEPANFDRIIYRIIETDSARDIAFRNQEIDLHLPTADQHNTMLQEPELLARTQHLVYEHIRTGYRYVAWNQQRAGEPTVFADKRVRQAMTMLLDRQRICDEIFLGFSIVANGPFHELGDQDDPTIEPWPYDPERAITLLKEAGFTQAEDGTMLEPNGEPFEIEIVTPAGSDLNRRIMLAFKDQFAVAGINLILVEQKWALLLQTLTSKDFEAITLGWGAGGLEGDIEQMFHTRNIANGDNRNAYTNPELDALIEQAHVTLDRDERMKIWQQTHRILHEDQPYTFLFRSKVRLWLDGRIANLQEVPVFGVNYVSTMPVPIEWYVPAESQLRSN
ncbi:ABC transporter substrate-binding protein [Mucisphaera sp.]|uniref:ABC transporter substrate-binding protein n=1 Tax=Mucisphaera sp. TaxID=2913024 RepID=UPI003D09FA3F